MKDAKRFLLRKEISRRAFMKNSALLSLSSLLPLSGSVMADTGAPRQSPLSPLVTLNNGIKMPMIGFGTYPFQGAECAEMVANAISAGYRLFDTATIYGNEDGVGLGIKNSGIPRSEVFVTSKLWLSDLGYDSAKKAFALTLEKLGLDYLDLYLIHRPRRGVKASWKAMEELHQEGKIRALGVSNFEQDDLEKLLSYANIKPMVNQIESHIYFHQAKAEALLEKHDIHMQAWSPFAQGRKALFSNPTLERLGKKYNKTTAQISLRWQIERGLITIPRTSQEIHMRENLDVFDFQLTAEDIRLIGQLDQRVTAFPEWVDDVRRINKELDLIR